MRCIPFAAVLFCLGACPLRATEPKVVHNTEKGLWDEAPRKNVHLLEDLILGSEEGDDFFGRIADVAVDSRGRIIVLDAGLVTVHVYDPDSLIMRTIGQKGEGPGEFNQPTALGVDASDRIYVASRSRIAVFAPHGELLEEFRQEPQGGNPATDVKFGPKWMYAASFDPVDDKIVHRYDAKHKYVSSFSDSWGAVKSMDLSEGRFSCGGSIDVDSDGYVYFTQLTPYEIRKFSPEGELLLTIHRENDFMMPPKIEQKGDGMVMRAYGASSCILALSDGKIMNVAITNRGEKSVLYATFIDVFDAEGRLLKSRRFEGRVSIRCQDAQDRLYVAEEREVPQVVRYSLKFQ